MSWRERGRVNVALSERHGNTDARHQAAVANTLGWADAAAKQGDFAQALDWIRMLEAIGHEITGDYRAKRQAWLAALDHM
jgi:hypothetical protein